MQRIESSALSTVILGEADAGELLTLQRAAYVSEAQIYNTPFLPALTQTLEDLLVELSYPAMGTRMNGRLIAAVRWKTEGTTAYIGRLVVAPDLQGRGVGSALLRAAETGSNAERFELFTGHLSTANIRLYEREGYRVSHRNMLQPGVELVYLTKGFTGTEPNRTRGLLDRS